MGTYIYALWEEQESTDQCGWYLAKILSVHPDGSVSMKYRKDNATEDVNLNQIKWTTASGRGKWFLPPSCNPQDNNSTHSSQPRISSPHKVRGFADDLTVLSSSKSEHENILLDMNCKCNDMPGDKSRQMCLRGVLYMDKR